MKKRLIIGSITAGILLFGMIGSISRPSQSSNMDDASVKTNATETVQKVPPVCDGTNVITKCALDGVNYTTYIYHPAVAEKSHTETVTTYTQKITGYCTACNDGTRSPSCATGRGTCSHHGGVAQWNAPIYSNVPEYSTKTVIDSPSQEAYYEKVAE